MFPSIKNRLPTFPEMVLRSGVWIPYSGLASTSQEGEGNCRSQITSTHYRRLLLSLTLSSFQLFMGFVFLLQPFHLTTHTVNEEPGSSSLYTDLSFTAVQLQPRQKRNNSDNNSGCCHIMRLACQVSHEAINKHCQMGSSTTRKTSQPHSINTETKTVSGISEFSISSFHYEATSISSPLYVHFGLHFDFKHKLRRNACQEATLIFRSFTNNELQKQEVALSPVDYAATRDGADETLNCSHTFTDAVISSEREEECGKTGTLGAKWGKLFYLIT